MLLAVFVLIAVVAALLFRFRDEASFVGKLAVPGPAYSAAEDRTSGSAARSDAEVPLPVVSRAELPTGANPAITLGPVLELSAPSALADPPGPGPVLVSTLDGRIHAVDLDELPGLALPLPR